MIIWKGNDIKNENNKTYCVKRDRFRKFLNLKTSYSFDKILVLCIICSKCGNNDERIFKKGESLEMLKTLGLIE